MLQFCSRGARLTHQSTSRKLIEAIRMGILDTPQHRVSPRCEKRWQIFSPRSVHEYGANEVILTVGGKHALYNIFQCLLDEGDEVLIPAPFCDTSLAALAGGIPTRSQPPVNSHR